MNLSIPELSLVVLIGASGCGKSTFARKHFKPTEILSSDHCRALICDDESNQEVTRDAFELVHFIASKRLSVGRLTVIDATSVQSDARRPLLALARRFDVPPVALVFNLPENLCQQRNRLRSDRQVATDIIHQQHLNLLQSLPDLKSEGFSGVYVLNSSEEIEAVQIARTALS
jgi:protein phosphatase